MRRTCLSSIKIFARSFDETIIRITPLRDGGFTCGKFLVNLCNLRFESDVIRSGNQTRSSRCISQYWFESDVIRSGNQTLRAVNASVLLFESDVIRSGNQTFRISVDALDRFESDVIRSGNQTF